MPCFSAWLPIDLADRRGSAKEMNATIYWNRVIAKN